MTKYVVTALNKITGEREIVSRPMSKEDAERVREKFASKVGPGKAYIRSRVNVYCPQADLFNQ